MMGLGRLEGRSTGKGEKMDSTERFSGKADVYERCRPGYPEEWLDDLVRMLGLSCGSVVADVGSGTGKLTRHLMERGLSVYAVEPNDEMRAVAERTLGGYEGFRSRRGTAEATGLDGACADLVTAGQAFHWFDAAAFRKECRRILRNEGRVALVWTSRVADDPVVLANARLCAEFCAEFKGFSGGMEQEGDSRFRRFFRDGVYEFREYANDLTFDLKGFLGRNLSASYALREGDAGYAAYLDALVRLFESASRDGVLTIPHRTRSYWGAV